jgi:hypothetical protein
MKGMGAVWIGLALAIATTGCSKCCNTSSCTDIADNIWIGQNVKDLCAEPYVIRDCGNGRKEYVYIYRNEVAPDIQIMKKTIVAVENDIVVDKWVVEEEQQDYSLMQQHQDRDFNG